MRRWPVLTLVFVSGCSSSSAANVPLDASTEATQDATAQMETSSEGATWSFDASCDDASDASLHYRHVLLDNKFCMPFVIPCGCRLLFQNVPGGCSQPGLMPATAADNAYVTAEYEDAGVPLPDGGIQLCVLNEQTPASTPGTGCSDQSTPGWCYVQGTCPNDAGSHCQQAVCTTEAFYVAGLQSEGAYMDCP